MICLLDTSVLLASLDPGEPAHSACDRWVAAGGHVVYVHALAEVFSVLTGGRQGRRHGGAAVVHLLEESLLPYVRVVHLNGAQTAAALAECEPRGIRGGAVYDWLHLAAAREAGAEALVTLNLRDFQAIFRPGDPRIVAPEG
ncbi:MAG: PIN domain-containing protein [Burkholderiales bacterium]|nr:PIN domain-containing protein [Burkholderiales bacterium]